MSRRLSIRKWHAGFSLSGILSFFAKAATVRNFYQHFSFFSPPSHERSIVRQGFCTAIQTYLELLKDLPENQCEVILEPLFDNSNRRSLQTYMTFSWCIPRLGKGASACQV